MRYVATLPVVLLVTALAGPALAVDLHERCSDDAITSIAAANGRNQWALACRLITKVDYDCATNNGYYWTFNSTTGGPNVAPSAPGQSCSGFRKFTMCPAGCFEATQRVSFGGKYFTPQAAYDAQQSTVTTLAPEATLNHLTFTEEAIGVYVKGEEKRPLVRIQAAWGQTLLVTHTHPLVDSTGTILPADQVTTQTRLMTVAGPVAVTLVQRVPYDGLVWNIRPVRAEPKANINVAEGFLTGSLRYQNEWASDAARLLLRQSLDASALE